MLVRISSYEKGKCNIDNEQKRRKKVSKTFRLDFA